jgi:TonB-linked SusC/RagA family outer membrane protein
MGSSRFQSYAMIPDMMSGEEFYQFKMEREPNAITASEQAIYNAGEWADWVDLATRQGYSHQHNLSVSGGWENTTYYISGNFLDVKGIQVNDNYQRLTSRINVDTKVNNWLTLGTRTQLSFDDMSGESPGSAPYRMNPLTRPFDDDGNLTIYPWPEDIYFANPLEPTLWDDVDKSFQAVANNYAIVNIPFVEGLSYRLNTGIRYRFRDQATYRGRDGKTGFEAQGQSSSDRNVWNNTVIENIVSYNRDFGLHHIFATALYSFENSNQTRHGLSASRYPHDFLSYYSAAQAEISIPRYSFNETTLISQMIRLNYSFDSRYLFTLTTRRDGFSGFGAATKWGLFPSIALGWNLMYEDFFPFKDVFSQFKPRISWGLNGNQAVGAYATITRLGSANWMTGGSPVPGYLPSTVGMDDLGWEASRTLNFGLDFGMFQDRITGDLNLFNTNTTDLLLNRTISPVHGVMTESGGASQIIQNIGQTNNRGIELALHSRNIVTPDFVWAVSGNLAHVRNKIVSLYGELDEQGNEVDDVANKWFIGHPIRVNYNFVIDGVWQLDEADEAAKWGSQPGFVKFRDVNGDYLLTSEDRQIVGQQDPKFLWGFTNSLRFRNFKFDVFLHGVHGVTRDNPFMQNDVYPFVRRNTIKKNHWTPNNPTNDFYMNHVNAHRMAGVEAEDDNWFESASFVRVKDVSFSYDIPKATIQRLGIDRIRFYLTGRNLFTFTNWNGLDPELDDQRFTPLQKEFVLGLNLGF